MTLTNVPTLDEIAAAPERINELSASEAAALQSLVALGLITKRIEKTDGRDRTLWVARSGAANEAKKLGDVKRLFASFA
jgi:hypothetical protein